MEESPPTQTNGLAGEDFPVFIESESSLLCSQKFDIGPHREPHESISQPQTLFL